jgi:hypothetical protein
MKSSQNREVLYRIQTRLEHKSPYAERIQVLDTPFSCHIYSFDRRADQRIFFERGEYNSNGLC